MVARIFARIIPEFYPNFARVLPEFLHWQFFFFFFGGGGHSAPSAPPPVPYAYDNVIMNV